MAELDEILRYWAADREAVPVLNISDVQFLYDKGWEGTDVTPGEPATVGVRYSVHRDIVHTCDFKDLAGFIAELAQVSKRGPFPEKIAKEQTHKQIQIEEARNEIDKIMVLLDPVLNEKSVIDENLRRLVDTHLKNINTILLNLWEAENV